MDSEWVTRLADNETEALHNMATALATHEPAWLNKYLDAEDDAQKRMLDRMWNNLHGAQPVVAKHMALRSGSCGPLPVIAAAALALRHLMKQLTSQPAIR